MNSQLSLSHQIVELRQLGISAGLYDAVDFLINQESVVSGWQGVARYFADILAATAYDLLEKKSTGKAERQRQLSICRSAINCLKAGQKDGPRLPQSNVTARLERILKEFSECK